jgi:glucosamine--fructose-6-phosphate aminotransferase (isomerizing)
MCGIIAYTGHRPAIPIVMDGLKRLEYRGYDSAGVAFIQSGQLQIIRTEGKLASLEEKLAQINIFQATTGIGHTRWATHGIPNECNAHPHCDHSDRLALVHNGIIENYKEIKANLEHQGYCFSSETDTEVLVQLISSYCEPGHSLCTALKKALQDVEGSYALAVIDRQSPPEIWAARHASPLILGLGPGEHFIASDIPAFLPYTRDVVYIEDGELVHLQPNTWQILERRTGEKVHKEIHHISWDVQSAQKGGYKHFMLKEIMEQPQVIQDCLASRIDTENILVNLPEIDTLLTPENIQIVACGTSYHAGLWSKYILEKWARIPVHVDIASEFRYRSPLVPESTLIIAISQSGETADTLACVQIAREQKTQVLGLCNVLGSTLSREADAVVYTQAGPEISVASTKAMCSQMVALVLLTLYWSQKKELISHVLRKKFLDGLATLPHILLSELPRMRDIAKSLTAEYSQSQSFFFLGRGLNYPLALEGALKLKEISYIHAEGYAAGEMKHGPIALIEPDFPTFVLAPHDDMLTKLNSNLKEIKARGGPIIGLTNAEIELATDHLWEIPQVWGPLNSFLVLPALQLFAYQMAVYLGKDVDQPRNLAKSVTVE